MREHFLSNESFLIDESASFPFAVLWLSHLCIFSPLFVSLATRDFDLLNYPRVVIDVSKQREDITPLTVVLVIISQAV